MKDFNITESFNISPKKIYKELDEKIAGQSSCKEILANSGFTHYMRTLNSILNIDIEKGSMPIIKNSNILIMGPSGCGKTYSVKSLADTLDLPFLSIDAKTLSNTGYVGKPIDRVLKEFFSDQLENGKSITLQNGSNSHKMPLAVFSVVFIDEFDKLCTALGDGAPKWNQSIQHSLLKVVEGTTLEIDRFGTSIPFNTGHMLFVLGGSFDHLVKQRKNQKATIGFNGKKEQVTGSYHKELIKGGVVKELAGRISQVIAIEPLTKKDLKDIVVNKSDSILSQYKELFEFIGYDLKLSNYHLNKIVDSAIKDGTGARGLQTALDRHLHKQVFNMEYRQ